MDNKFDFEEGVKLLTDKQAIVANLNGCYFTKSPYHKRTLYLPFIIRYYDESLHSYMVSSVEYKGLCRYRSDAYYTEDVIDRYISERIIQKVEPSDNSQKKKLVSLYIKAKEPLE